MKCRLLMAGMALFLAANVFGEMKVVELSLDGKPVTEVLSEELVFYFYAEENAKYKFSYSPLEIKVLLSLYNEKQQDPDFYLAANVDEFFRLREDFTFVCGGDGYYMLFATPLFPEYLGEEIAIKAEPVAGPILNPEDIIPEGPGEDAGTVPAE